MKKFTLLSIVALILFTSSKAQIGKGTILIGGTAGVSTGKVEGPGSEQKSRGFNINPSFGVAVKENLVMGLNIGYSKSKIKYSNNPGTEAKVSIFSAGAFARKYQPLSKRFYFFGEGGPGVGIGKQNYGTPNSTSTRSFTIRARAYPGVAFDVNRWLQLETSLPEFFSIGYTRSKNTQPSGDVYKESSFDVDLNISPATNLNLGIKVLLR